jgi:hypothetical protein
VTAVGFEACLERWRPGDGTDVEAVFSYVAASPGTHELDGRVVVAGSWEVESSRTQYAFPSDVFGEPPVVLSQVVSDNDPSAVAVRLSEVTHADFIAKLVPPAPRDARRSETMHFMAWEAGSGRFGGRLVAAIAGGEVTDKWTDIAFGRGFERPRIVGSIQTTRDDGPRWLRMRRPTTSSVKLKIKSGPGSSSSTEDQVGLVVFG